MSLKILQCAVFSHCNLKAMRMHGSITVSSDCLWLLWAKISADGILKYSLNFPRNQDSTFHANVSVETICMKCKILFPGKIRKKKS